MLKSRPRLLDVVCICRRFFLSQSNGLSALPPSKQQPLHFNPRDNTGTDARLLLPKRHRRPHHKLRSGKLLRFEDLPRSRLTGTRKTSEPITHMMTAPTI